MRSAFVGILRRRGVRGLYAGLSPTLVEIIPYAGLQFGTYDTFKRWTMVGIVRILLYFLKPGGLPLCINNKRISPCKHGLVLKSPLEAHLGMRLPDHHRGGMRCASRMQHLSSFSCPCIYLFLLYFP